ncbi:2-oxoglutarate-dependent dioxygenase [Quillaja saponaria]|uniref:2-oxoglutarate-dependent dioxygenase n=1 Tax=Quillaja saponaria TaxID=32244 RepID=A0AAD7PPM7_QUISA|nr:2-oxoglutarate-dependent dioxygenase [Quillaja saponaria]
MGSQLLHDKLPVIDFTDENLKPGTDSWNLACNTVRHAFEEYGCFVALYDKVSAELHNSIFKAVEEIFNLPAEIKRQKTSDKPYHSYYAGQAGSLPLFESLGIDDVITKESVQSYEKFMFPAGNESFCETVTSYSKLVAELDQIVKRMVFDSYGVEKKHCDSLIESTNYLLRGFKYRVPEMEENNLGIHSHRDTTFMSILHQNHISGLQIQSQDGEWIDTEPSPSSYIVMAGEASMVWSNGRVRPCEHKVIMNGKKTRYSLGLFSFIKGMLHTPEEVVDEQNPLLYKPFDHYGYLNFQASQKVMKPGSLIQEFCGVN